jgi:large subunit ribosomal protein L13
MKTTMATRDTVDPQWCLIDATDKKLGRLATIIATRLRGKHKAEYTPHVDVGDHVVVLNAEKIAVTGKKKTDKLYYRHSGYPGGLKTMTFDQMQTKKPGEVLKLAVKGMLPRGPLGRQMLSKLKIYPQGEHPHQAQQPFNLDQE